MLETLISSKTRVKLLLKFFLNSKNTSYLRGLESEFGESSNAIRLELNRFEKAGMLVSQTKGNKKLFRANTSHPLFNEVHNIILKNIGFDTIIDKVITRLGDVENVYVVGDFALGINSQVIDLVFLGSIDIKFLIKLIKKTEKLIDRKIRYITYSKEEKEKINWLKENPDALLLWTKEI